METVEEFLEHFGVKGMRWGVKKAAKPKAMSGDAKKAASAKTKSKKGGVDSLTNKELKTMIERMRLEKQFSELNQSNFSKGVNAAKNILSGAKTLQEAYSLANKAGLITKIASGLSKAGTVAKVASVVARV